MSKRRSIAIVGLPDCGKTVLLTELFRSDKWKIQPLNKDTMIFLEQKRQDIKNGKWPEPTPDNIKAKEFIQRVHSATNKSYIDLKFRDFAGETWKRFINTYCELEKTPDGSEEAQEICDFLNRSVAVAICVDLEKLFDNDINQRWIIQAILNYLEKQNLSIPIALIITKYDVVKDVLREKYNITDNDKAALLTKVIGINSAKITKESIFAVSAVQADPERYSDKAQKYLPKKNSKPIGLSQVENWFFEEYNRAETAEIVKNIFSFWPAYLIIGGIILGNLYPELQMITVAGVFSALLKLGLGKIIKKIFLK